MKLPGHLCADNLVLCDEFEQDRFVEVCRRKSLKVSADKSKVMVVGLEEGLQCEIHVDRVRFG